MEFLANDSLVDLGKALPSDVQRYFIDRGYTGTKQTIQKMQQCVSWGKRWPGTRRNVSGLIRDVPRKDYLEMVHQIFNNVQDMQYVFDPSGVEAIQGPDVTEELRMGDCDDFSVKIASDCESIGIPCYFKTIKAKPGSDEFTHVYVVAVVPGVGKVPLDATMPYPAGWEAANGKLPGKLWPSSNDEMEMHGGGENSSMSGLGRACTVYDMEVPEGNARFSALPIQSAPCDYETISGLDCIECGENCGASMSGLDGLGETDIELSLSSVIDGTAYSELRAAKDESNQRTIQAGQVLTQARASGNPQALAAAQQAVAAAGQERNSLYRAINAYSQLANNIQTYSLSVYRPQQLSGLGVAPAVVSALLAVAAVYALAQAFSVAMAAWRGDANASKTLIQQATDLVSASGHAATDTGYGIEKAAGALKTVAIVGVVGALFFIGYKVLAKRGTV